MENGNVDGDAKVGGWGINRNEARFTEEADWEAQRMMYLCVAFFLVLIFFCSLAYKNRTNIVKR